MKIELISFQPGTCKPGRRTKCCCFRCLYISTLFKEVKAKDAKIKDIEGLLKRLDQYEENKPFFDEKYKIRNKSDQDAYSESHRRELTIFNAARRVLKESNPTGNIPKGTRFRVPFASPSITISQHFSFEYIHRADKRGSIFLYPRSEATHIRGRNPSGFL